MINIFIAEAQNKTNGIASGLFEKRAPVKNGKVIQPIAAPKTNLDASAPFMGVHDIGNIILRNSMHSTFTLLYDMWLNVSCNISFSLCKSNSSRKTSCD